MFIPDLQRFAGFSETCKRFAPLLATLIGKRLTRSASIHKGRPSRWMIAQGSSTKHSPPVYSISEFISLAHPLMTDKQRRSSGKESKRWGVYYIIGLVFKTYFEVSVIHWWLLTYS